jgi:tetratricopeptide (TPR) repeat protein
VAGKIFGLRRESTADERGTSRRPSVTAPATQPANLRASDLFRQARDLFAAGQYAAAIPVFQAAIDIIRRSPNAHSQSYQGMLGVNLCLKAQSLRQTGSLRLAVSAAEESAAIFTAISGPDMFTLRSLETVALSLHSLSERPKDKAAAAMRAAALLEQSNDSEPNRLNRRLVMLNLAANVLNDSKEIPEALRLRKEATEVATLIAEADPAARHRLAIEYSSLAVLHAKVGDLAEACVAGDACDAAMSDPEFAASPANRFVIARNLSVLAHRLARGSLRSEALRPYVLATDMFRALGRDAPEPIEPRLARCLNGHAWALCHLGRPQEALPLAEEAAAVAGALTESPPTAFGLSKLELLSSCLDTLATALAMAGRKDEALAACCEALGITRGLAEADPERHRVDVVWIETLRARIMGSDPGSFIER